MNYLEVVIALTYLADFITLQLANDLKTDILSLYKHSKIQIRKSASILLLKIQTSFE